MDTYRATLQDGLKRYRKYRNTDRPEQRIDEEAKEVHEAMDRIEEKLNTAWLSFMCLEPYSSPAVPFRTVRRGTFQFDRVPEAIANCKFADWNVTGYLEYTSGPGGDTTRCICEWIEEPDMDIVYLACAL